MTPKRAKPKRCGAKRMKNLAAMRRQVEREMEATPKRMFEDSYDHGKKMALRWVLANVLTTPKPNRKRGGK